MSGSLWEYAIHRENAELMQICVEYLNAIFFPNDVYELISNQQKKCLLSYFHVDIPIVKIPPCVTFIGHFAFEGCKSIKKVIILSSVTSIGDGAFKHCSNLEEINLQSSVTFIGENIFLGAVSLKIVGDLKKLRPEIAQL